MQVLVLTLSRELLDYSHQDLADRLTDEAVKEGYYQTVCDVRMARKWEGGGLVWPQERYRILLERVFGKPFSEHGFVRRWTRIGWTLVAWVTSEPQAKDDVGDPVPSRKDFPDLFFDFAVLLDKPEEKWFRSEVEYPANGEQPRRIGMRHIERTKRLLEQIDSLDHREGGGALLSHALNVVRAARVLLRKSVYSGEVGTRLERATSAMIRSGSDT